MGITWKAGRVDVAEKTRDYVSAAKARAILRTYQSDWADFSALAASGKDSTTPGFGGDHSEADARAGRLQPHFIQRVLTTGRIATRAAINGSTHLEMMRQPRIARWLACGELGHS